MNDRGRAPRYHHGDLRNALLQAALEILEGEGLDRLTLRGIAARVGVSHAAPAHHFGTLTALRTALATIGYARFAGAMRDGGAAAPDDPPSRMRGVRRGYLAFATAQPALFRLMCTSTALDWTDPDLCRAADAARAVLTEICAPAAARLGVTDPAARIALEHMVWAEAHGLAQLIIDGQVPSGSDPGPDLDLARLLFGA